MNIIHPTFIANDAMKKRVTAKKACKYLKLDSKLKIPICMIEPIICTNWFCDVKGFKAKSVKCNLQCFRKCAIKNPDASIVPDSIEIYENTILEVNKRLEYYKDRIPRNELIGGILAYRELEILRAFFGTPGAFTDVFQVLELIPEDISFITEKDIFISQDCRYFLHLHTMKNVLSMELNRIKAWAWGRATVTNYNNSKRGLKQALNSS